MIRKIGLLVFVIASPLCFAAGGGGVVSPGDLAAEENLEVEIASWVQKIQEFRVEAMQTQYDGLVGGGSTGIVWGLAGSDGRIYQLIPKNWELFDAASISSHMVLLNPMNGVYTVDEKFTETLLDSGVFFQELDLSKVPFDQNLQILVLSSIYSR